MTVTIRRRRWLAGTVAGLAALICGGYLWRFTVTGDGVLLAVGLVLAAVALVYCAAWWGARYPLLVADATGLRVRLASKWTGVPWDEVRRVEVSAAGRVTDGRLLVQPAPDAAALLGAGRRSRLEAAWNQRVYGAPLAIAYGLATQVSVDDLPAALRGLADGRSQIVVPTTDASPEAKASAGPEATAAAELGPQVQPVEADERPAPSVSALPQRASAPRPTAPAPPTPTTPERSRVQHPVRRLAAVSGAQPARREDVTIAMRREAVEGSLALSAASDEARTEELPEVAQLRRDHRATSSDPAPTGGNVSLIIDATTDLSARAMRKVRRPLAELEAEGAASDPLTSDYDEHLPGRYLGAQLRQARENLRLTVDDLADRTRIRPFVIECMEADDFSPCGGDFYARGHLRMLARVLGIASEPLIATYDERFASSPVSLRDVFDVELATGATGMVRGGGAAGAHWGGLVATVLILLLIWGVARFFTDSSTTAPADPQPAHSSTGRSGPHSFLGGALDSAVRGR